MPILRRHEKHNKALRKGFMWVSDDFPIEDESDEFESFVKKNSIEMSKVPIAIV